MQQKLFSNFENNFKSFLSENSESFYMQNQKCSVEYVKAKEEFARLFDEISDRLGKNRKLIFRLEELQNQMGSIDEYYTYLQGFIDCVSLLKIIRML